MSVYSAELHICRNWYLCFSYFHEEEDQYTLAAWKIVKVRICEYTKEGSGGKNRWVSQLGI